MSSLTFDGVWFVAYSDDHPPPHVHGRYGRVEVIVELVGDGVKLSNRRNAIRPKGAKASDVKRILRTAAEHWDELRTLWEKVHG